MSDGPPEFTLIEVVPQPDADDGWQEVTAETDDDGYVWQYAGGECINVFTPEQAAELE